MKKRLFAILCSTVMLASTALPLPVSAADDDALWEKFLRYDLCITDYDALTEEEQELCHFIYDTEQSSKDTIRCERARRTLAHDPDLGERLTLTQLENVYGICDWYGDSLYESFFSVHCVPDIRYLDEQKGYNIYWLNDTGTEYIQSDGEYSTFKKMIYVKDGEEEELQLKPRPRFQPADFNDKDSPYQADITDYPDFIEENGDYYCILPDETAVLVVSRYKRHDFDYEQEYMLITEPVVIPERVQGCPVIAINSGAFNCSKVTEVRLPETVQFIGSGAFHMCASLNKINVPTNIKKIGKLAFGWTGLTELNLDAPALHLGTGVFQGCEKLKTVNINVNTLGSQIFINCQSLSSVTLGSDTRKIENDAFQNCTALESIVLPESVRMIGTRAFDTLSAITIPSTVQILGTLGQQIGSIITSGIEPPSPVLPLTDEPICTFSPDCVISGYAGTEAERYAKECGLQFIALETVDGDGTCSIADAVLLAKHLAGNAALADWQTADRNGDGSLDARDLTLLLRMLAHSGKNP